MAKKIRLGLNLFFNNATNSGIVNYIYNIVSALKTLPQTERPNIVVFYIEDSPVDYIKEIGYPEIKFVHYRPFSKKKFIRSTNNILKRFIGIDLNLQIRYLSKIDVLYPYFEFNDKAFSSFCHKVHWLVDFNNCAFPSHYQDNGKAMYDFQKELTAKTDRIVLSSGSLLAELKSYFPNFKNKVDIVRFACSMPDVSYLDIEKLKTKFELSKPYFMSPNQFWEHKNQLALVEALGFLKKDGPLGFQVAFTGSMEVNRGKGHMLNRLLEMVERYGLEENVKFLGLINRHEQILLMKHASALIQPSLYEGWSTLVEEAKALNQRIILSDLPVHREQNCANSYFFDPHSPQQLAKQIQNVFTCIGPPKQIDYTENIKSFGRDFLTMLKNELGE